MPSENNSVYFYWNVDVWYSVLYTLYVIIWIKAEDYSSMVIICPYKKQSLMLQCLRHCIQIFTNTCRVTTQVKRDVHVGKTIYYTKYQYITYTCVESPHYLTWFVVCFPIVVKFIPISHTELSVLAALNLCKRLKSSSNHVIRFLFNKYSKAFLWQFFNTMSLS